jgi:ATP-dependent Clp protease ATP-binding subunit ClpA
MTTNAGAAQMAKAPLGFQSERRVEDDQEEIKRLFTPEFRNRLDAIVPFHALRLETVLRVVDKFVMQLEAQLAEKNVTITLSDKARDHIGKTGYDPAMGARPLSRLIQEKIKKPLAEELLFGDLREGGSVYVDFDGKDLLFSSKADKKRSKTDTISDTGADTEIA